MTSLTEAQRTVVAELQGHKAEAICFDGQWWFQGDVRQAPDLAERMVKANVLHSAPYWPISRQKALSPIPRTSP
jgi:hypothetical protein